MIYSSQMRSTRRAPRIALRGTISATIQLENGRKLSARLHQLSVTGGLFELPTYIEERARVGLTLAIGSSVVCPKAEMLFPMWGANGYLQPFRFTRLWADERRLLEMEITELLKQTLARSTGVHGLGFRPPRFNLESF